MIKVLSYLSFIAICSFMAGCVTTVEGRYSKPASAQVRLQAQLNLARGYLGQADLVNARKPLEKALNIDSTSSEAHVLMAMVLQAESDDDKAEKEYRLALRYDRTSAQVLNNFGSFLYSKRRYKEAAKYLESAVKDDSYSGRAQAFENLGLTQLKLAEPGVAEQSFQRALNLNGAQARSMLELAELYFGRKNYALAQSYYGDYLQLARQTARSLWLGIRLSRLNGDEDRVASYALALRNLFPDSRENRLYQGSLQ